jgi:hypothetical protein
MFKNTLLISLFMVSATNLLYGGHGWSQPSNTAPSNNEKNKSAVNAYEVYQKELYAYLEGLKLDGINNKFELQAYLETAVNRDIHDRNKFPLYHTFLELNSQYNEKKAGELDVALRETIKQFFSTKKIPIAEDKNEHKQIDNK